MKKILMVVALLATTAGMAYATSVSPPLTGSLCVNKSTGVIRSAAKCAATEVSRSLPVRVGPQGAPGPPGPSGAPGAGGASGPQGPGGRGPAGSPGQQGQNGAPGPTGPTGANGTAGNSGTNGAKGATGPAGPTGPSGTTGYVMGTICVANSTSAVTFAGIGDYSCNQVSSKYHILVQP